MTRSELIVALLDMPPSDEDIVFEHISKNWEDCSEFTIQGSPSIRRAQESYNDRIVIGLREI